MTILSEPLSEEFIDAAEIQVILDIDTTSFTPSYITIGLERHNADTIFL